jgi:uncharacterized protein YjbJ (UPF0337 family)
MVAHRALGDGGEIWEIGSPSFRISRAPMQALALTIDHEERAMNWDRIEGNWKQIKGSAKETWGKLTDDELDVIAGKRDQLAGKIQESYGISKDEAEKQLAEWEQRLK